MKNLFALAGIFLLAVLLYGCGGMLHKEIVVQSQSTRSDIFTEVDKDAPVPVEFGTVQIKASIKTRHKGYYVSNLGTPDVGKSGFPFLLNIDGQAVEWKIDGQKEKTPKFEKGMLMPEGGEGMRYVLNKTIRIKKGSHRIFFGLSRDNIIQEFNLNIKDGPSTLEIIPVYKSDPMIDIRRPENNDASYVYGIKRLDVYYDGEKIKTLPDTVLMKIFRQ